MDIQDVLYIKSLIIKYHSGNISAEEKQFLEQWAELSPRNREVLECIHEDNFIKQAISDESKLEQEQWKKLCRKTIGTPHRLRMRFLRYAAAVILPVALGVAVWLSRPKDKEVISVAQTSALGIRMELADGSVIPLNKDSNAIFEAKGMAFHSSTDAGAVVNETRWNRVIVPKGTDYIVRLEDGSSIHLNAESTLEIPERFDGKERRIRLSGEAYMNIMHEENRPFIVETERGCVKVLGTQFNLRAYPEEQLVSTTLVRGSVEVSNGSQKTLLEPGMQAIISSNGEITRQIVNTLRYTAWRDGLLVFENEYVEDIIKELKHWYDYDFIITDPAVKQIRLSMNVEKSDDFNDLKTAIEKIEKIHFEIDGKIVKVTQ